MIDKKLSEEEKEELNHLVRLERTLLIRTHVGLTFVWRLELLVSTILSEVNHPNTGRDKLLLEPFFPSAYLLKNNIQFVCIKHIASVPSK